MVLRYHDTFLFLHRAVLCADLSDWVLSSKCRDIPSPLVLQLILFRQDMLCSALLKHLPLSRRDTFSDTDPFLCSLLLVFP